MKEEHKKNIFETIDLIMKEVPAIGKTKQNTKQNYKFRGIDDVMNKLQPIFAKYKLFVVPDVLEQTREERKTSTGGTLLYSICKIKYTFYAEDGSPRQLSAIPKKIQLPTANLKQIKQHKIRQHTQNLSK